MRSITLEILRHGPPHNQLLSPLTPYLALCENRAAVTVTVPFEHGQFLQRLRALSYELPDATRVFQLEDTGREMGSLLGEIPGLIAELSQRYMAGNARMLHLRMVLSASELALLPFELVISPNGFPGEGRSMLLQTDMPVCITREVRQASGNSPEWSRCGTAPRILFAAASPPGVAAVPLESHLLALRAAIDPWVFPVSEAKNKDKTISDHLVVLPQATIEQIREQCATGTFSHVHILAHGLATTDENTGERSYGLALHDSRDPAGRRIVDGKTLALTLRSDRTGNFAPADPLVVTLASCNAGSVGSVVSFAGAGASVAHSLHAEGIPVVIASQFPLSFRGSVKMVETLYPGLLRGDDPRELVHDLRGQLQGAIPDAHDWASLVTYAALPSAFDRQLERFQVDQAHRQISAALGHVDMLVKPEGLEDAEGVNVPTTKAAGNRRSKGKGEAVVAVAAEAGVAAEAAVEAEAAGTPAATVAGPTQTEPAEGPSLADEARAAGRVEVAKRRLGELLKRAKDEIDNAAGSANSPPNIDEWDRALRHYARISGLIAAAEKRHAELLLKKKTVSDADKRQVKHMLMRSLDAYWDTYYNDRSKVWAVVQHIFVHCILEPHQTDIEELLPIERNCHLLWESALNASLADLQSENIKRQLWARDNLLELRLLQSHLLAEKKKLEHSSPRLRKVDITGNADEHIRAIRAITGGRGNELYSIYRQIGRFAQEGHVFSEKVRKEASGYAERLRPSS